MSALDLKSAAYKMFVWVDPVSLDEVMSKSALIFVCLAVFKNESFEIADGDRTDHVWFLLGLF